MAYRVSKPAFGDLVLRALGSLPTHLATALETTRIEIRERPTPRMLRRARVKPGYTLLGLYEGRPQTRRSIEESGTLPDVIYLFQHEIEDACNSEEELVEQVRTTVLHEIGHHYGLGEHDLDELGYG
jgi:predicted Zn-dependent protease with MMP-like domain